MYEPPDAPTGEPDVFGPDDIGLVEDDAPLDLSEQPF